MNTELNSMLYQRRMLGLMCALLAPSAVLFGLFGYETNPPHWYKSISETFFANSNICMIGLLFATAVFFFSYRGYDWRDRLISVIQAVMCLGVISFPTDTIGAPEKVGLFNLPQATSSIIHNISAFTLFFAFVIASVIGHSLRPVHIDIMPIPKRMKHFFHLVQCHKGRKESVYHINRDCVHGVDKVFDGRKSSNSFHKAHAGGFTLH